MGDQHHHALVLGQVVFQPLDGIGVQVVGGLVEEQDVGLTQEQLAVLAGVSKPTLNAFEQGKTTITLENAIKILRSLGME